MANMSFPRLRFFFISLAAFSTICLGIAYYGKLIGRSEAANPTLIYSTNYFDAQSARSYSAAKKFATLLSTVFNPKSVVDLGCGRGAWLKAFKETGAVELVGSDGNWISQDQMLDSTIVFHQNDLNKPISFNKRFDLAVSTEVGEHLEPSSAPILIKSLTQLSDTVLFSAAYTNQGGPGHINEQPHTYWAKIFEKEGFVPFDFFRPQIWGDESVPYYYRQNVFLYVRMGSKPYQALLRQHIFPMKNVAFMNCLHPSGIFKRKGNFLSRLDFFTKQIRRLFVNIN